MPLGGFKIIPNFLPQQQAQQHNAAGAQVKMRSRNAKKGLAARRLTTLEACCAKRIPSMAFGKIKTSPLQRGGFARGMG